MRVSLNNYLHHSLLHCIISETIKREYISFIFINLISNLGPNDHSDWVIVSDSVHHLPGGPEISIRLFHQTALYQIRLPLCQLYILLM